MNKSFKFIMISLLAVAFFDSAYCHPPLDLVDPDKNIDHRRVPNLQAFFERRGWSLDISSEIKDYLPGDMVTCIVPPHLPHIMIISDKRNIDGIPFVIHNIGAGAQEEDRLFDFKITGHFRFVEIEQIYSADPKR